MSFVNTSVSLRKYITNYTPPYTGNIIGVEYNSSTNTWKNIDPDLNEVFPNSNYFDNHPVYSQITPVTIDSCAMVKIPKFYFLYQNFTNGHRWWISNSAFTIENVGTATVHTGFIYNGVTKDQFYVGAYECSTDPNDSSKAISASGVYPFVSIDFSTMVTRCQNRNNGDTVTGFDLWNIYQLGAIQMLCLIEMGNGDSQVTIGTGNSSSGALAQCGSSDATYRGIHELWANAWCMVRGLENRYGTYYYWSDAGNETFSSSGISVPSANGIGTFVGNISHIGAENGLFLTSSISNSSSSMFNDDFYSKNYSNAVCGIGGNYTDGANAGLFYLIAANTASFSDSSTSCRLSKV